MTTEVDFSLTLQLAGSHLRQRLVFFFLRKEKVPAKRGRKEFVSLRILFTPVLFLSSLFDWHPRSELGLRDKTRTEGC